MTTEPAIGTGLQNVMYLVEGTGNMVRTMEPTLEALFIQAPLKTMDWVHLDVEDRDWDRAALASVFASNWKAFFAVKSAGAQATASSTGCIVCKISVAMLLSRVLMTVPTGALAQMRQAYAQGNYATALWEFASKVGGAIKTVDTLFKAVLDAEHTLSAFINSFIARICRLFGVC